jgi:hypothetical protein
MGVGIGIGGAILVLGLLMLFLRYRRKRLAEDGSYEGFPTASVEPKPGVPPGTPGTPATTVPSELELNAARPWSLRSELESGTPISINGGQFHPSPQSGSAEGQHGYQGQHQPYRPGVAPDEGAQVPLRPILELPG